MNSGPAPRRLVQTAAASSMFAVVVAVALAHLRPLYWGLSRQVPSNGFNYEYSEWLIDYSHGFVRRGLGGELISVLSDALGTDPMQTIYLVSLAAIFGLSASLLWGVSRATGLKTIEKLAIVAAPFGLVFAAHEAHVLLRRDFVFLFLAMVPFLLAAWLRPPWRERILVLHSVLVLPVSVLIHEITVVFIWPSACLLTFWFLRQRRQARDAALLTLLLQLPMAAAAAAVSIFYTVVAPGDLLAICENWQRRGVPVPDCTSTSRLGALSFLSMNLKGNTDIAHNVLRSRSWDTTYIAWNSAGLLLVVAQVSLLASVARPGNGRATVTPVGKGLVPALMVLAVFLPTLPMYVIAIDWGRYVWISMTVLTFAALTVRRLAAVPGAPPSAIDAKGSRTWPRTLLATFLVVAGLLVASAHCCTKLLAGPTYYGGAVWAMFAKQSARLLD